MKIIARGAAGARKQEIHAKTLDTLTRGIDL